MNCLYINKLFSNHSIRGEFKDTVKTVTYVGAGGALISVSLSWIQWISLKQKMLVFHNQDKGPEHSIYG